MRALAFDNAYEGGSAAAELIADGLVDADHEVRVAASMAARSGAMAFDRHRGLGDPLVWNWSSDNALRAALLEAATDEDDQLAANAMRSVLVAYPPDPEIEAVLVARYSSSGDPALRESVVAGLGQHGYASAEVTAIIADARGAAEADVRSAAAIATAKCQVPDAEGILQSMLASETDSSVMQTIEAALDMLP